MTLDFAQLGRSMHALASELFPLCRSITGPGLRKSLHMLREAVGLEVHEVPSGTKVFDWTVPNEWTLREAWIADSTGRRIVDVRDSCLHVVNYSIPIRAKMRLAELRPHLHSLPDKPDWIPHRTSYYSPAWGFCLTHRQLESLVDDEYEVVIDTTIEPGHLSYGELVLPGTSSDEILFSTHACHPSLANDNLSGLVVQAFLARILGQMPRRHTMRFLWIPATIGSITWLAGNEDKAHNIRHGLVMSCLGDTGGFTYKRSRRGDAPIDRAVEHLLAGSNQPHRLMDFSPFGYDERQFCSPGFNLPVGLFMRTMYGGFPEYHTSADNLDFIRPESLAGSLEMLLGIVEVLERDRHYLNTNPKCEPQLGRRGLYGMIGGHRWPRDIEMAMLWVLNQSDGQNSLLDIARRSKIPFAIVADAADALAKHGLLREISGAS